MLVSILSSVAPSQILFAKEIVGAHSYPEAGNVYLPFIQFAIPPVPNTIFGVQMYGNTGKTRSVYPELIASKASWVRANIGWKFIEPANVTPDKFNWSSADRVVGAARDAGIHMLITFEHSPEWAATLENGPIDIAPLSEYAEFVGAVVERYDGDGFQDAPGSPEIDHYELFNEPDLTVHYPGGWGKWGEHGKEYAEMLSVVYPVMKAANPDVQVVLGGIGFDGFEEDNGHAVRRFLDDVLDNGGGDYFDILGIHTYPFFAWKWACQGVGILQKTRFLRNLMAQHGINKPVMLTEGGVHSNPDPNLTFSEELQARYLVEMYVQALAAEALVMIWFMFYETPDNFPLKNGLLTDDNPPQRKQAFYALQTIVTQLSTTEFAGVVLEADTTDPNDPNKCTNSTKDLEAYKFSDNSNNRDIYVAWRNPIDSTESTPLALPGGQAIVRDIYGAVTATISDANDGVVDGRVTVSISGQPSYIEIGR
ncbi:glycoside hydrolase family 5 protein [Chloroflexi bacterium TSY]|nr:glycoside hydrolase family 5 protein [Chloroflexi bacterium TSY]